MHNLFLTLQLVAANNKKREIYGNVPIWNVTLWLYGNCKFFFSGVLPRKFGVNFRPQTFFFGCVFRFVFRSRNYRKIENCLFWGSWEFLDTTGVSALKNDPQ